MKKFSLVPVALLLSVTATFAQSISYPEHQIAAAVQAAPEGSRADVTVLGYDANNALVTLREGTTDIVCLADDPAKESFSVACYHKSLEPFMTRGRELRAEGKAFQEVFDTREREVKSGTLRMPIHPTTLYVLSGEGYDASSNTIVNSHLRFVVYVPYATSETTGLSSQPTGPGEPWLMDAGTHRAHIMITPPRSGQ